MRLILFLLLVLAVTVALIVFPDIADQPLRLEAFGWLFETRQGAFVVALLALLSLTWLLRRLLGALFASPGSAWRSLRLGSRKRKEKRLRDGLAQWIDGRLTSAAKNLRRAEGVLPAWIEALLRVATTPASALSTPSESEDDLMVALSARIATAPDADPPLDAARRRTHLEAWLRVHPDAPLAQARLVALAEEEGDWPAVIEALEAKWRQGKSAAVDVKPRLVRACLQQAAAAPAEAMVYLRKAYRLQPEDAQVVLRYGQALQESGDLDGVKRLWRGYLEQHSSKSVAAALLELERDQAMRAYRKLERKSAKSLNYAQRWLRAELAHAAGLDGLALEQMQALAEAAAADDAAISQAAWQSLAAWHEAAADYQQAANCYRWAMEKRE